MNLQRGVGQGRLSGGGSPLLNGERKRRMEEKAFHATATLKKKKKSRGQSKLGSGELKSCSLGIVDS